MAKMWAGRSEKETDIIADEFNSSIAIDCRMYRQDIKGSMAHAAMLAACNIITQEDLSLLLEGLEGILNDLESGRLNIDPNAEDIHMFVEQVLTDRIGDTGKKLHTARSRNDQVALDFRMYLRDECEGIIEKIRKLIGAVSDVAEKNIDAIMPGYTHLQRAQPVRYSHQILAYAMMFMRDIDRLNDAMVRMNESPLGACALAGTTYNTDRGMTAKALGFGSVMQNSIDAVSDRDFCIEIISDLSILMMHLSRFCEEIILFTSLEFNFIELDDAYTTGSSIMPQKKNSDMAELVRGKTGRVYGDLMAALTMMKGLPLAYNKDMQEDKHSIFDALDTVNMCLDVFTSMIATMKVKEKNMYRAAQTGFINATDLADYLTKKGEPFRTAYKIVGQLVGKCIRENTVLEDIPLDEYKSVNPLFGEDLYEEINLKNCVEKRTSEGGTSKESVLSQINYIKNYLKQE